MLKKRDQRNIEHTKKAITKRENSRSGFYEIAEKRESSINGTLRSSSKSIYNEKLNMENQDRFIAIRVAARKSFNYILARKIQVSSFFLSVGTLVVVFLIFSTASATVLVNYSENASLFASRTLYASTAKAYGEVLRESAMYNPDDCQESPAVCKFRTGLSKADVKKLQDNPRVIIGQKDIIQAKNGNFYFKKLAIKEKARPSIFAWLSKDAKAEKVINLNSSNFLDLYLNNPHVMSVFEQSSASAASKKDQDATKKNSLIQFIAYNNGAAIDFFKQNNITRANFFGDEQNKDKIYEMLNKKVFCAGNAQNVITVLDQVIASAFDNYIAELAQKAKEECGKDDGLTINLPSTARLGEGDQKIAAERAIKSSNKNYDELIKTMTNGAYGGVCQLYRTIKTSNYSAQTIGAINQVRLAMLIEMLSGMQKYRSTAESNNTKIDIGLENQIGVITDLLQQPSIDPETRGLNYSSAESTRAILGNKIDDKDLAKLASGTSGIPNISSVKKILQEIYNKTDKNPDEACEYIKNIHKYDSPLGWVVSQLPGGDKLNEMTAITTTAFVDWIFPRLINGSAGISVSNARKQPSGGLGLANQINAGYSFLAYFVARTSGAGDPVAKSDLRKLHQTTEKLSKTMERSLAINTGDYTSKFRFKAFASLNPLQQNIRSGHLPGFIKTMASLAGNSTQRLLGRSSSVYASQLDNSTYKTDLCGLGGDLDYTSITKDTIASDLNCAPIFGYTDANFSLIDALKEMQKRGDVDEKRQMKNEFAEYYQACMKTIIPLTGDFWTPAGYNPYQTYCSHDGLYYKRVRASFFLETVRETVNAIKEAEKNENK